jgi:hypothetical protein
MNITSTIKSMYATGTRYMIPRESSVVEVLG